MKILVSKLAREIDVKQLQDLFSSYGDVESCDIILDKDSGKSKGFGFVEMPKDTTAKAAIRSLNGKKVAGERIRVREA